MRDEPVQSHQSASTDCQLPYLHVTARIGFQKAGAGSRPRGQRCPMKYVKRNGVCGGTQGLQRPFKETESRRCHRMHVETWRRPMYGEMMTMRLPIFGLLVGSWRCYDILFKQSAVLHLRVAAVDMQLHPNSNNRQLLNNNGWQRWRRSVTNCATNCEIYTSYVTTSIVRPPVHQYHHTTTIQLPCQ